jgi:excisionase family DNA binding protein
VDDILTVQEVSDYLKISKTTIWRWCKEGKLGASKIGHSWRIHRAEVERVLTQGLDETQSTRSNGSTPNGHH